MSGVWKNAHQYSKHKISLLSRWKSSTSVQSLMIPPAAAKMYLLKNSPKKVGQLSNEILWGSKWRGQCQNNLKKHCWERTITPKHLVAFGRNGRISKVSLGRWVASLLRSGYFWGMNIAYTVRVIHGHVAFSFERKSSEPSCLNSWHPQLAWLLLASLPLPAIDSGGLSRQFMDFYTTSLRKSWCVWLGCNLNKSANWRQNAFRL